MTVEEAFNERKSDVVLQAKGKVTKLLPDDIEGHPHQRFIIETHPGHTILVVNNTQHGYRVPVKLEDTVEVKGSYVWNQYGGLIHETHHSQEGEAHEDGFITLVSSY
jgi:hypothetical protein